MSRIKMIVPPFLVSKLCPFDYLSKYCCMRFISISSCNFMERVLGQDDVLGIITVALVRIAFIILLLVM